MNISHSDHDIGISSAVQILPAQIGNSTIWDLQLSLHLANSLSNKSITTLNQLFAIPIGNIVKICDLNETLTTELSETLFSITKQIDEYFSQTIIEEDMLPYDYETENWIHNVFAKNPLVGNKKIKEETEEKLYNVTKRYIELYLSGQQTLFSANAQRQITLAVITLARRWNSDDDNAFWPYIIKEFGFRSNKRGSKLRTFLCKCVKETLKSCHRLFIEDNEKNHYKTTIMSHSFSPKKTWFALYDLLFDFYIENMQQKYTTNDPLISMLAIKLREKLLATDFTSDNEFKINAKIFSFRIGIRRLIIERPRYMARFFDDALLRIDAKLHQGVRI